MTATLFFFKYLYLKLYFICVLQSPKLSTFYVKYNTSLFFMLYICFYPHYLLKYLNICVFREVNVLPIGTGN